MDADPQWLGVLALLAAEQGSSTEASSVDGSTVARVEQQFSSRLHPGVRVGRFEVERPLGRGGMGSVYAAYDPKLRRSVALKILHASKASEQPRLAAEARALAQVNHPNVITVHDVGRWQERVFVAMELLDGQTLRQWRTESPRSWREVLAVYADAARGLAAAHDAGIVHRDIKPSNVMVTATGRVVVVDFGLAVDVATPEHTPSQVDLETRGGSAAGTPAYMAPEQRRGERAGPGSDQFSLCVSLHEALEGELPEVSAVPLRTAGFERCAGVPARLSRIVRRGLAVEPGQRHPSMRALVDALDSAGSRALWPWGVAVGAALLVGVAWPTAEDEPTCSGADEALAEVWTPQRRARLGVALRGPGGRWAEGVAETVLERLDGYTHAWSDERAEACRAEREDDTRLGARMLCLDRRLRTLDALVTVLEEGDVEVVSHATEAVDALPSLVPCRSVETLAQADGARDPEVEALRDRLAYAEALRDAASVERAEAVVREILRETVARQDRWLEAEARLTLGWVEHDLGRHEQAEEQLRLAVSLGTVSRNDRAVSTALHRLAWVVGYKLGRHREGFELADQAQAWAERLEGDDDQLVSRELSRGWIFADAGQPKAALEHFEKAAAWARRASPTNLEATYDLGLALNGIGAAQLNGGDLDAAADAFDQSAELLSARLGPEHPRVAQILNNRAGLLRALGKPAEALQVFERTAAIFERVYGPEHPAVGKTMANMAIVLNDLGRFDEGVAKASECLRILSAAAGEDHLLVAKCYALRGDGYVGLKRHDDAVSDLHRALAMETELLGADHPSLGISQSNLSIAYDEMGRLDDAVDMQEQALELLVTVHGDAHNLVATARMNLAFLERKRGNLERSLALYERALEHITDVSKGLALLGVSESLLLLGRPAQALPFLREAATFLEDKPPTLGSRGDALFLEAQARWELGERAAAKALAQRARQALIDEDDPELREEVERWLGAPRRYPRP